MKKVILSVAIGMALSVSVTAANAGNGNNNSSGSAYDRKQDARIDAFQSSIDGKVSQADFEADQQRHDNNINELAQGIAIEAVTRDQKDKELQGQIDGKVGQADFDASQQAQNNQINAVQDAAQTANDRATSLEGRADAAENAVRETNAQLEVTDARSINNAERLDGVESVNSQQDATLADHDSRINSTTSALETKVDNASYAVDKKSQNDAFAAEQGKRDEQYATLSTGLTQAQATGEYAHSRIDAANANIEANRQALANTNQRVAANTAQLANHEQRITGLEQSTNARFADLNKQIDDNRKRASAGIAGVAAMANIPQVTNTQVFSVGAGVGHTDGESALAVGFSARATENTVVKASVSNDTQHNFVVGAGVSYGW